MRSLVRRAAWLATALALTLYPKTGAAADDPASWVPALWPLPDPSPSELRDVVSRFTSDHDALSRRFDAPYTPNRRASLRGLTRVWQDRLPTIDYEKLSAEARIDWNLLSHRLRHDLRLLDREEKRFSEAATIAPFQETLLTLVDRRRRLESVDPKAAARALAEAADQIEKSRKAVAAGLPSEPAAAPAAAAAPKKEAAPESVAPLRPSRIVAYRTAAMLQSTRSALSKWYGFFAGYDPLFTWWCQVPYRKVDAALEKYIQFLREKVVGWKEGDDEPIVGDPIGRAAILEDLSDEFIAYTPEELITIAEREFAWCDAEMKRASREMGFGDDWKKALEKVKTEYVEPGRQAELVRDLHREATDYVVKHDLVTVPPFSDVVWRMEMMTPERQKTNPFFLGGEEMFVSFPTDSMSDEDKRMSLRGNNVHFSRATVFHEQIPGHHLQAFYAERYNSHRNAFDTPFYVEGWALHWEMLFWDLGFTATPEDRVGALFWRMHRCARIIFSLSFHLGKWTPQQCIDFLVERVGHERANATAEVRRSFNGDYSPLYQLAYMMGALQFRALQQELVGPGKMSLKEFHDGILKAGNMPIEMVRASLTKTSLPKSYEASWRFAGEITPAR